jgi:hypothetical protein
VIGTGAVGYASTPTFTQDGTMLQVKPVLSPTRDTVLLDLNSVFSAWGSVLPSGSTARSRTVNDGASSQPAVTEVSPGIDRVSMLVQHMGTTIVLPLGVPVVVGGMTLDPAAHESGRVAGDAAAQEAGQQMYLIVEVTASKSAE